jgi:hypothetical protein
MVQQYNPQAYETHSNHPMMSHQAAPVWQTLGLEKRGTVPHGAQEDSS